MAKFTVYFKNKPINSSTFESGVIHIGRDETNDLIIDSLAIAPAHAAVIIAHSDSIIKQLNSDFPLIINDVQTKESKLKNGDTIIMGKHRIMFSCPEAIAPSTPSPPVSENKPLKQKLSRQTSLPDANFQVIGGMHIGRLINLKKSMTRLGRSGGIIIISHRTDGYYISMLEPNDSITLNDSPIADKTILLKNNDVLLVDKIPMQFFMG